MVHFARVGGARPIFEELLMTRAPQLLSSNLSSLKITAQEPISRTLFASLSRTKRLHIYLYKVAGNQLEELENGINIMPAIEALSIENCPILNIPKTLRQFDYRVQCLPESNFFAALCQVEGMEDLRLSFVTSTNSQLKAEQHFSLTNWSQITEARLQHLRILQICTQRVSKLLNLFCSATLRVCSSLEELKLYGVGITDETILSMPTNSLRKLSLSGHTMIIFTAAEIFAGLAEPAEQVQWNSLCKLLERNPNISKLKLDFDLSLPPLTYNDIENISTLCPRLNHMELYARIRDDEEESMLLRDSSSAYKLEWVYSRSSASKDKVIKSVLKFGRHNIRDDRMFALDFQKFRRLKDRDVIGVEGGQSKNARSRRGSRR